MTLVICICTYNRNPSLVKCLKSINNLLVQKKVKVKIVIVDNSINYSSFKTVKKLINVISNILSTKCRILNIY